MKLTLQACDQFRNGFSRGFCGAIGRLRIVARKPPVFLANHPVPSPRPRSVSIIVRRDLRSRVRLTRACAQSQITCVRARPSVSANLRPKSPLIARPPHFDCAPLHLAWRAAGIEQAFGSEPAALGDFYQARLEATRRSASPRLENRLAAVMGGKMAVGGLRAGLEPFIEQLAAPTATPGGGSAAAASGAMAAGLANMVAAMSRGKKAYVQHEGALSEAIARLGQLREELKAAIDADAESYNLVMKAYKAAKESSDGDAGITAALKQATSVPLGVAERVAEVARISEKLGPITNPNMKSDLTTAVALARAALTGALANVEINLESLQDEKFVAETRGKAGTLRI